MSVHATILRRQLCKPGIGNQHGYGRESGKNAIVLDPDDYMISLFEPNFSDEKNKQTSGYVGFTPQ